MQILHQLYDKGVDYVDIEGHISEGQDIIRLYFQDSYIDPEYIDEFEKFMEEVGADPINKDETEDTPKVEIKKLTDEDLNQLII